MTSAAPAGGAARTTDGGAATESGASVASGRRPRLSPKPLARLLPRLRPYRLQLALAFVCLVIAAAGGLVFPRVVQQLLDAAFLERDRGLLDRIALLLLGVFAVQAVTTFAQVYLLSSISERVVAGLREELFAHLVRLSPQFFTERRSGELTSRLSADLAVLQTMLASYFSEFARQTLYLIGGVVLLALTNPRLMGIVLLVTPLVVGAGVVCGRLLRAASTGVQDRVAEAMASADEAFGQIRTVQGFVREGEEVRRFRAQLETVIAAALRKATIRASFFGIVGFIAFGAVVGVLWQGGQLVLDGLLTAGQLVSFLLYAITVAAAVGALASVFGNFQEAIGATVRVLELLDTPPSVAEPATPVPLARPVRGAIAFEDVGFRYGAELPEVLHGFTLAIRPGETLALVGPSGAGKTTIASLVPRFWDVTAGRITLDGVDVRALSFADLRGSIGVVPQEPALFSGTIRENIAFARPDASEAEVLAAAKAAHAWEFVQQLPQGLDTRVGERGVKLSGGQRQRIAIARVFLKDPQVVILDEATSSLDTESERLVEDAMAQLLEGRTTIIIAHRLSTVQRADRLCVLERGRIVETGTHAALLAADGMYAKLYRGQFRDETVLV